MQCTLCAVENSPDSTYCQGCGSRLFAVCPECDRRNLGSAMFCGGCGIRLPADPPCRSTFGVRAEGALLERKQATVFFADIVRSTELVAGLDPEEAAVRLQPALTLMQDAVEKFGGTVAQVLGNADIRFGLPKAHEAHAVLACSAALFLQSSISESNGLPLRIGLHSGTVLAAVNIDPSKQLPKGEVIHLANRVQAAAEAGKIFISGDCYRLIKNYTMRASLEVTL